MEDSVETSKKPVSTPKTTTYYQRNKDRILAQMKEKYHQKPEVFKYRSRRRHDELRAIREKYKAICAVVVDEVDPKKAVQKIRIVIDTKTTEQ
jgi:hypothetical protein